MDKGISVELESEVEKTMVKIIAENAFNGMYGSVVSTEDGMVSVLVDFGNSNTFTYRGRVEDIEAMEMAS